MDLTAITQLLQEGVIVGLKIAVPILIVSMVVGVLISIFQAATQINEQTLSFVPKLITIVVILIALGPWMGSTLMDYLSKILSFIGT